MADFDYVIIGSGAGGGPLAANLARSGRTVALLEAGGDPCLASDLGRWMCASAGRQCCSKTSFCDAKVRVVLAARDQRRPV